MLVYDLVFVIISRVGMYRIVTLILVYGTHVASYCGITEFTITY